MLKVGDLVYVSNPDTKYEEEYSVWFYKSFFGTVTGYGLWKWNLCRSKIPCNTKWVWNGMGLQYKWTITCKWTQIYDNWKFKQQI